MLCWVWDMCTTWSHALLLCFCKKMLTLLQIHLHWKVNSPHFCCIIDILWWHITRRWKSKSIQCCCCITFPDILFSTSRHHYSILDDSLLHTHICLRNSSKVAAYDTNCTISFNSISLNRGIKSLFFFLWSDITLGQCRLVAVIYKKTYVVYLPAMNRTWILIWFSPFLLE